jgi:hypothetical protein
MASLKKTKDDSKKQAATALEKTIYASDAKVDRTGQSWRKRTFWVRQEYLSKLKMIGHFEGKKTQQLLDEALSSYLTNKWDNSMALRKLVEKTEK